MVLAISFFGVSDLSAYIWFAFAGAAVADGRRARDRGDGPRRRHPGQAGDRRRRAHRGPRQLDVGRAADRPRDDGELPVLAGRHGRRPRLRRAPDRPAVPRSWARCWPSAASGCSTPWPSATTWPAGSGARSRGTAWCSGVACVLLAGARDGAGRADRVRRPDRARTACAPSSAATTPGAAVLELGCGAVLVVARRHGRPGGAAADRGAGRDHDRGRRRAGVPAADPPRPDRGAVMTVTARLAPRPARAGARRPRTTGRRTTCAAARRCAGARLVVGGSRRWCWSAAFAARVLLGDFTITHPRLLPDPRRRARSRAPRTS